MLCHGKIQFLSNRIKRDSNIMKYHMMPKLKMYENHKFTMVQENLYYLGKSNEELFINTAGSWVVFFCLKKLSRALSSYLAETCSKKFTRLGQRFKNNCTIPLQVCWDAHIFMRNGASVVMKHSKTNLCGSKLPAKQSWSSTLSHLPAPAVDWWALAGRREKSEKNCFLWQSHPAGGTAT